MDQDLELIEEEMAEEILAENTRRFHDDMDTLTMDYITEAMVDYVMGGTDKVLFTEYARHLSPLRLNALRAACELLITGTD